MLFSSKRVLNRSGITLIELIIATALVGGGIMAGINAFDSIQKSIQISKARSLATNLGQEKMQILKQRSYNRLMISTSTLSRTDFTPNITYDNGAYPPETILEGSIYFTRLTNVEVAQEDSGSILTLPATTPDTGMKLITVTVIWAQGSENRKIEVRSVDSNPNTIMSNAILNGTVRNAVTNALLPNATVVVAENVGWRDTTSATGIYTLNLSPGTFDIVASADGYMTSIVGRSISPNVATTQNFLLTPISSGTIRGTVWTRDHLVISQVVGSTQNASTGFFQEYVEIFNPSTFTWTIATNPTTPAINLLYSLYGTGHQIITMNYNTLTIAPGRYYLFANTTTITAVGVTRTADAVFNNSNSNFPNIIKTAGDMGNDAGSVSLLPVGSSLLIDRVGWKTGGDDPLLYEGTPIQQITGLEADEQFVRRTSTAGVTLGQGRAYDGNNNDVDFMQDGRSPMIYPPRSSADAETTVAGTPAVGAIVTATDGLSLGTTSYSAGTPPYAEFSMAVATGTHTVFISSGTSMLTISTVAVTANTITRIPNATTVAAWPAFGQTASLLSSLTTGGFISGRITNITGGLIVPGITVSAGGISTTAGTNGVFTLSVVPGNYTVVINPNNANPNYVSQEIPDVNVTVGGVTSGSDAMLSQGGRITGYTTRDATNALAGVSVAAYDSSGRTVDQAVSGTNGLFTLVNLTTGTYTVGTILDSGEDSTPDTATAVVTVGATVSVGTFTITGAYGTVEGMVTLSGNPIKTGVLIIVSTATVVSPPALSSATLTGIPYYIGSSTEDGTYSIDVRGSTSTVYRVHAFYPNFNGSTPVITSSAATNITITAGATRSGVNFTW